MEILNKKQIEQKLNRLAMEIVENHFDEKELYLAGINNNGLRFAKLLLNRLQNISDQDFKLVNLTLNPASPLSAQIDISVDPEALKKKTVIIVDDVANTGRTIFYAFKPFLEVVPKKIEVAVLIDRKHKSFPVKVDYLGLSLATTMKDNIDVKLTPFAQASVCLD